MNYTAEHIHFTVGNRQILSDVGLTLSPGKFVAVLGPNGAGKSTLLKIMTGELKQQTGAVKVGEKDIDKFSTKELALVRAVLPQHSAMNFPFRAFEVVLTGRTAYRKERAEDLRIVEEVMKETGSWHLKDSFYNTMSGGEQQRVQLARVLAQIHSTEDTPRFLFVDEPSSSLDIAYQHQILGTIRSRCEKQVGVMAILHDLNLAAQYADEILFLCGGKSIAHGKAWDVLDKQTIESTFNCPVHIWRDKQGCPCIVGYPHNKKNDKQEPINPIAYEYLHDN